MCTMYVYAVRIHVGWRNVDSLYMYVNAQRWKFEINTPHVLVFVRDFSYVLASFQNSLLRQTVRKEKRSLHKCVPIHLHTLCVVRNTRNGRWHSYWNGARYTAINELNIQKEKATQSRAAHTHTHNPLWSKLQSWIPCLNSEYIFFWYLTLNLRCDEMGGPAPMCYDQIHESPPTRHNILIIRPNQKWRNGEAKMINYPKIYIFFIFFYFWSRFRCYDQVYTPQYFCNDMTSLSQLGIRLFSRAI